MKDRKKSYYLILLMPILYALLAYGMVILVHNSGVYPSGKNTLAHLYKGDVLYHAICRGDYWPAFDFYWYNIYYFILMVFSVYFFNFSF